MGARLRRWLDLRPGEETPVFTAMLVLLGLVGAHTMLETARDALFLGALPAHRLSLVYALLAGLSLVATRLSAAFVARFGRRNALVISLMAAAYGTILIYLGPRSPAMAFVLYLWSALVGTILILQFWMTVGNLFTVAQGKRLFGPLAAGGVLGAVTGAAVAAVLLERFDVGLLLPIASAIFVVAAFGLTTTPSDEPPSASSRGPLPESARAPPLRGDRYLVLLGTLVALVTAATLVSDYLFKSVAASAIPKEQLGVFLARVYAGLNALALVVQVFVAGALLRRVGVVVAAGIMPLAMMLGAGGLLLSGGALSLVVLLKGADGTLKHSLHRVASELLWMPVPDDRKGRAKGFMDAVLGRGVQAVVGGLLLLLSSFELDTPVALGAMTLALATGAVAVAASMRLPYLALFRDAIAGGRMPRELPPGELDLQAAELLIEAMSSVDPDRVIAAMDLLWEQKRARLIPSLIFLHHDEDVLLRALEIVATPDRKDWLPQGNRLLDHSSERVRTAAVRALVGARRYEVAERLLDHPSPSVRAQAIFCMAHCDEVDEPLADPRIRALLDARGPDRIAGLTGLLEGIRDHGDARWIDVILAVAEDPDPGLGGPLGQAAEVLPDPRMLPHLVSRLGSSGARAHVRSAILAVGPPALDYLDAAISAPETPYDVRLHLPRTISLFREARAVEILTRVMTEDPRGSVRFKAMRGLGRLLTGSPLSVDRDRVAGQLRRDLAETLRMRGLTSVIAARRADPRAQASREVLLDLLEDKQRQALGRVFRLLQMMHRTESLRSAQLALESDDPRSRAQAFEFLDALTVPYLASGTTFAEARELLLVLADDLPVAEQLQRAARWVELPAATADAALAGLIAGQDRAIATLAAQHARDLGLSSLEPQIEGAARADRLLELREVALG